MITLPSSQDSGKGRMIDLILLNGIPRLIQEMAFACEEKQKYYDPNLSIFGAWADVLKHTLPQMLDQVDSVIRAAAGEYEVDTIKDTETYARIDELLNMWSGYEEAIIRALVKSLRDTDLRDWLTLGLKHQFRIMDFLEE